MRCFFGFHPWRRWEAPFVIRVSSPLFPDRMGEMLMQRRECADCGRIQERKVRD